MKTSDSNSLAAYRLELPLNHASSNNRRTVHYYPPQSICDRRLKSAPNHKSSVIHKNVAYCAVEEEDVVHHSKDLMLLEMSDGTVARQYCQSSAGHLPCKNYVSVH